MISKSGSAAGVQNFARTQLLEFVPDAFLGVGAGKFGGAKLASGEVKGGEAYDPRADGHFAGARDGGEKIVFLGAEGANPQRFRE